MMDIDYQR